MGKTKEGVPHPFFALLHLPFRVVGWLSGMLQTVLRRKEEAFNLIAPGLWLGRRLNNAALLPQNVRTIVDLTSEHSRIKKSGSYQYYVLPLLDGTAPTLSAFEDLLASLRDVPEDLYIHCWAGRGRSATVLAGVLIERGLVGSVEEAIELMQARRPQVKLSATQHTLLNLWHAKHAPMKKS
jgi:protein-tyrosine phosphatase